MKAHTRKDEEHIKSFGEDMREQTHMLRTDVDAAAKILKKDLKGTARKANKHFHKIANDATHDATTVAQDFYEKMQENPFHSIGIALGAGFLVGLVCRSHK